MEHGVGQEGRHEARQLGAVTAMGPITQGVIARLIANGLTAIIAHLRHKGRVVFNHEDNLLHVLGEDAALRGVLQEAAVSFTKAAKVDGDRVKERLQRFVNSPDADAVVRQIFASQVSTSEKQAHLELVRAEFMACLSLYLEASEEDVRNLGHPLFEALLIGCDRALGIYVEKGVLSAHEAKAAFRHRLILDELAVIQKNLTILTAPNKPNLQMILEFEEKYRQQVGSRHGHITPPHFDAARKLPIDEIYVSSDIIRIAVRKGEEPTIQKMPDFLSVIYRAVILGNPGGGKSTFTLKLCHDLATRYSERLFAGRQVTPILVVLRDYGAEKKARSCSILQFIETTANSKYQVPPPTGAFEYLLLNGRAVVIFDGLDELLDTSYRQEISGDVESFCSLYPSVPVLVTSREVGYEQAPLDERRFEVFSLSPFDEDQVREYATKWFAADTDLTPEQQRRKADAFLEESQIVSDLRANPLMLALMCNIYRGENYIPRNRPEVYEKCAVMLFERWDKSRGILVPLPFEAHINPAMKYLAHWIYSDEALQGGVTERDLVAKATEYLCSWRFEDRDEAEHAAREFIEFCNGRAWVFTVTGTRREGERLYQFTHRTFLEYFTAAHLVRTHAIPDSLGGVLRPRITRREWDVVAQLAFQLQHKNVEGAGDQLLTGLISQAHETGGDNGWNLLSFAARCLEFMVPRPRVTRDITLACTERCLAWGLRQIKKGEPPEREFKSHGSGGPREILGDLLHAASENRAAIADSLEKLLIERINGGTEADSILALEIGMNLTLPLHRWQRRRVPHHELWDFWAGTSNRIFDACSNRLEALCPRHFPLCLGALWRGRVPLADLISWHGLEGIFRQSSYIMFPGTWRWAAAESFVQTAQQFSYQAASESSINFAARLSQLEEVGRILLYSPPPWLNVAVISGYRSPTWFFEEARFLGEEKRAREPMVLSPDALFAAFALLAAILEASDELKQLPGKAVREIRRPFFDSLRWIFVARFDSAETEKVQAEMDRCGFTTEQQTFGWRWVRREIDLVRGSRGKNKKRRKGSIH